MFLEVVVAPEAPAEAVALPRVLETILIEYYVPDFSHGSSVRKPHSPDVRLFLNRNNKFGFAKSAKLPTSLHYIRKSAVTLAVNHSVKYSAILAESPPDLSSAHMEPGNVFDLRHCGTFVGFSYLARMTLVDRAAVPRVLPNTRVLMPQLDAYEIDGEALQKFPIWSKVS
ncbi:SNF2-related protein [Penicillium canescens]|nr:SNF2-related protein [Penicillium canescens]